MSIKFTILFALLILISSKTENSEKFLSHSLLNTPFTPKIFASDETKLINIKCLFSKGYNMYSLQSLQNKDEDYKIEKGYNNNSVLFNFCRNTHVVENATFVEQVGNTYVRLAGSIEGERDNVNEWVELDKKEGGLTISFVEGDYCNETESIRHAIKLTIKCDPDVDDENFYKTLNFTYSDGCKHNVEMSSIYGCSLKSTYLLLKLFNRYKIVFAIIFVLVGILLCFLGNKYITYTIIFVCGIIGCYGLTAAILSFFPKFITTEMWLIGCLVICFVLGCVIGFFLRGEVNFAILLFGAFVGYSCSIFLYQIVQNYVSFDPQILYYICIGVCIVLGGFLGWKLTKPIIIIGTSIFGAYVVMRGVSLVAGHYLDEGYVIDLIKNKEWDQLKELRGLWTYVYLGIWVVLSLAGIFIQCRSAKRNQNKKPESKK